MSSPAGPSRGGGRTVLAVLLAAVLLAVIGASVGVILGTRELTARGRAGGGDPTTAQPGRTTPRSTSSSAAKRCPPPTEKAVAAKGSPAGLIIVLYIETQQSEVWICRATDDKLWYQGHRKSQPAATYPAEDLIEGQTSLMLGNVNALTKAQYRAVNTDANGNRTDYTVSAQELVIEVQGGKRTVEKVIRHDP